MPKFCVAGAEPERVPVKIGLVEDGDDVNIYATGPDGFTIGLAYFSGKRGCLVPFKNTVDDLQRLGLLQSQAGTILVSF
jgi:hypothetical protein